MGAVVNSEYQIQINELIKVQPTTVSTLCMPIASPQTAGSCGDPSGCGDPSDYLIEKDIIGIYQGHHPNQNLLTIQNQGSILKIPLIHKVLPCTRTFGFLLVYKIHINDQTFTLINCSYSFFHYH